MWFLERNYPWDLEAAPQQSIVASASVDRVKRLHIFLDVSFSAFPTYSDVSFSNFLSLEFTPGDSIRYVPVAPRFLAIFLAKYKQHSFDKYFLNLYLRFIVKKNPTVNYLETFCIYVGNDDLSDSHGFSCQKSQ